MCLLVKQPATTKFSDAFLRDVYLSNSDGLGVMFAEDNLLYIRKMVPRNEKDFMDFFAANIAGKDCIWHARMRTHGATDLDNCHPYEVTNGVYMAHNGILRTGNDNNKSLSDTWHFIRNYLGPALKGNPELLFDADFQDFLGDMIGSSNKFGFMDNTGRMVIINESAGVKYEGAWLSNTYAWDYYRFSGATKPAYLGYKPGASTTTGKSYSGASAWGSDWDFSREGAYEVPYENAYSGLDDTKPMWFNGGKPATPSEVTEARVRPMLRALMNCYERKGEEGVAQWVKDAPHKASTVLGYYYDADEYAATLPTDNPEEAVDWLCDLITSETVAPHLLS